MQELRFVAVSEDGSYAVLAVPGRSGRYVLPIDERLRAVALGQTSRLAQYEIEVESPLRPKEIQARIRAGETAEEIADAAGIPVERVRWFEGPVLAERAYIADQAQSGSVRRGGDSAGPGPRLGDIVTERLSASGTDPADGQWDSRKRGDGNWQISLTFPSGGRLHVAEWVFDPRRRHVMPDDDNAARLSLPETELPAEPLPKPGEATVTPIASRLGAAAGMGGGGVPGVSRFRPDRSVIPDRSLGVDRSLVERPAARPDRAAGLSDRTPVPAPSAATPPASPRPGQQDRQPYPGGPANPGYAEFPESAPYRAPEPARAERAPASYPGTEPAAHGEPVPERPIVFEDPAPGFPDEHPQAPAEHAPGQPAPDSPEPEPISPVTAAEPSASDVSRSAATDTVTATSPTEVAASAGAAAPAKPTAPAEPSEPAKAPDPAKTPTAPATTPESEAADVAAPAAETIEPTAPAEAAPEQAAKPTAPEPTVSAPAAAEPAPAEAPPARRPSGKKNSKARRSSVPSWDEIMLGSSRQRD